MISREKFPKEVVDSVSKGFKGELELLHYEYAGKTSQILETLRAISPAPGTKAAQWLEELTGDKDVILSGIDECAEKMVELDEKVKAGLLSLMDADVCRDVAAIEQDVLTRLTDLQKRNSASLQRIFSLSLPARVKELEKAQGDALKNAIGIEAELAHFMSNELQDLAISLKEHNKLITHPLDENHPE